MLASTLAGAAARFGDRHAFSRSDGSTITFAELDRRSSAVATRWRQDGLGEGSVVALTVGSTFDYVVAYAAASRLGAITSGINPSLTTAERDRLLAHLGPDLVVDRPFAPLATPASVVAPVPPAPDRGVAVVFTSGTTGTPKGAMFRERQLTAASEADLGPGWEDRWGGGGPMLASTQFAHVGFMTKLPWYLRLGITTHVLDRWRAADVLRTVAEHRIDTLGVVAPQLALMLRDPVLEEVDVSCVQRIIAGGAASPPALVRGARERFGAAYSIRYSSTESGGIGLATAFDAPDDEALFTVGRPRDGVEVRVVGPDGGDADVEETGELLLRTTAMFDGYWKDADATAATLVDGWIRTGDLARIDAAGRVVLAGRVREMYIRGGYNVAPAEVEAVLGDHPGVAAVAIAPRPDDVMGEIGVAVVVPADPHAPPSLRDLRDFGARRLARWKLPEAIALVDELPLTAMQKLDRRALTATARSAVRLDSVGEGGGSLPPAGGGGAPCQTTCSPTGTWITPTRSRGWSRRTVGAPSRWPPSTIRRRPATPTRSGSSPATGIPRS